MEPRGRVSSEAAALLLFSGASGSCSALRGAQLHLLTPAADPCFFFFPLSLFFPSSLSRRLNSAAFKKAEPVRACVRACAESASPLACIPPFESHGNTPVQVSGSGPICALGKSELTGRSGRRNGADQTAPTRVCIDLGKTNPLTFAPTCNFKHFE